MVLVGIFQFGVRLLVNFLKLALVFIIEHGVSVLAKGWTTRCLVTLLLIINLVSLTMVYATLIA